MVLTLDIGNTRIKGAVFENDTVVDGFNVAADDVVNNLTLFFQQYPKITDIITSSVSSNAQNMLMQAGFEGRITEISHQVSFPFSNSYETPATLGIDRMVLASGAVLAYPSQHRLVIDAGTCVTYDFVSSDDVYHGGAISPGLRMRYEAMHTQTARLPLLDTEIPDHYIGSSTTKSMHSGAVNGLLFEIDGFISEYRNQYPNIIIILTGGDSVFLAKRLKNTIFANSNFLLESLNLTYHYLNRK